MNAGEAAIARLKAELTAKQLFDELKPMESQEKAHWDMVIDSRRPKVEPYDNPYGEDYYL